MKMLMIVFVLGVLSPVMATQSDMDRSRSAIRSCGSYIMQEINRLLFRAQYEDKQKSQDDLFYNSRFNLDLMIDGGDQGVAQAKNEIRTAFTNYLKPSLWAAGSTLAYDDKADNHLLLKFSYNKEDIEFEEAAGNLVTYQLKKSYGRQEIVDLVKGFYNQDIAFKYNIFPANKNLGISFDQLVVDIPMDMGRDFEHQILLEQTDFGEVYFMAANGERFKLDGFPVLVCTDDCKQSMVVYGATVNGIAIIDSNGKALQDSLSRDTLKRYVDCVKNQGLKTKKELKGRLFDIYSDVTAFLELLFSKKN